MPAAIRTLLFYTGAVLVSMPLAIVLTLLLYPLWSWVESSTGFESVGHSGPAEWCYVTVFALLIAGVMVFRQIRQRKSPQAPGI